MEEGPYPPYDPTDPKGFSYETVVKRWPVIVTGIIDRICRINHKLSLEAQQAAGEERDKLQEKVAESTHIISEISRLKYNMGRHHVLEHIPDDGEADLTEFNAGLDTLAEKNKNTWFTAPWLFAECYLYRRLRALFSQTKQWKDFDPFLSQKMEMFKQSKVAIFQLAKTMHELESEKSTLLDDENKLHVLFNEMIQMCLWGNATDLSLLTHLSPDDIKNLQTVGRDAQAAREAYILRDDQSAAWKHLKTLRNARIDFILDNAGFELFTDLVFADFLVTYTPYVSTVTFHPKLIPWFVSDVTPPDFVRTIESLLDPTFFSSSSEADGEDEAFGAQYELLKAMVTRWRTYIEDGTFALSVPTATPLGGIKEVTSVAEFWTSPWPYWHMQDRAPELFKWLTGSGLVVFKGDLNYRKLTGDIKWPVSTPLETALAPLAGSFPLLSLRTNKADVVVGVDQEIGDRLDAESGNKWRVDGRYALISFLPKV